MLTQLVTLADLYADLGTSERQVRRLLAHIADGSAYTTHMSRRHKIYVPLSHWGSLGKNLRQFVQGRVEYEPLPCVYGFVKGGSTYANASRHLNKDCVLRIDIQRFFPSITVGRIQLCLESRGFAPDAAALVSKLVTVDGGLAIGLSVSPMISNLVMTATDVELSDFATEQGVTFTRYADDLIFSGSSEIGDAFASTVTTLLDRHDWHVNDAKTAFMRRGNRQFVTGLYVGCADRPHVPRELKRRMRWIAHMIESVGYDTYMKDFGGDAAGHYRRHLLGWARYIAAVEPRVGVPLLHKIDASVPEIYEDEDSALYAYLEDFGW